MSRFTKKVVAKIVLNTVASGQGKKHRSESALNGMEANVIKALQYAEYVHHLAFVLVTADAALHKRLKASRRKRAALSRKVQALMVAWGTLSDEERFDLVWAAEPMPSPCRMEWWDRPVTHIEPIVKRIDANLNEMNRITIRKLEWTRGRRGSISQSDTAADKKTNLIPLIAFAKALKAFWELATKKRFGQQFDEDKNWIPVSAAANFLLAAIQYLPGGYTATHLKTVMIGIQNEGWSPEDNEFRDEVAKICNLPNTATLTLLRRDDFT